MWTFAKADFKGDAGAFFASDGLKTDWNPCCVSVEKPWTDYSPNCAEALMYVDDA